MPALSQARQLYSQCLLRKRLRVILLRSYIRLPPSDIALRAAYGEYNITAIMSCRATRSNITVACDNITLTRSAYHLCFNIAFVSIDVMLVKKKRIENVKILYPFLCLLGYTALSEVPLAAEFFMYRLFSQRRKNMLVVNTPICVIGV